MSSALSRCGFLYPKTHLGFNTVLRLASTALDEAGDSLNKARPYEEIPGPKPLPIIGNLHQFIPKIGILGDSNLITQQRNLMKKYGKIVKISNIPGRRDIVYIFDPKYFEEMYRNEGPLPDRDILQTLHHYRLITRKDFFQGVGGLIMVGEEWKKFRSKVNPLMMQPRIVNTYLNSIAHVTNEFIERTKYLRDSKGEMPDDYMNELSKWSLESIAVIALDKRLGCLKMNLAPDSEPQRMIRAAQDFFVCLEILELNPPLWKIISTPTWKRYVKALDYFTSMVKKNINESIAKMNERKPDIDYEPSVLERLLLSDPDPRTAYVMALDMLAGGIETTSYAAANVMYHLSKNQDKQEQLFKELVKFLPRKDDEITTEMIDDMKYLKACIKESLRFISQNLKPPSIRSYFGRATEISSYTYLKSGIAGVIARATIKDTVIGNYRIPKKVNILMAHFLTGLLDENFPQASRFIPERWLKSRPTNESDSIGSSDDFDRFTKVKANSFVHLPFGFGPRVCIGKRFAELELHVLIIKAIRNFHLEYNYGEMKYVSGLLNKPISPLKYKMTEREK